MFQDNTTSGAPCTQPPDLLAGQLAKACYHFSLWDLWAYSYLHIGQPTNQLGCLSRFYADCSWNSSQRLSAHVGAAAASVGGCTWFCNAICSKVLDISLKRPSTCTCFARILRCLQCITNHLYCSPKTLLQCYLGNVAVQLTYQMYISAQTIR